MNWRLGLALSAFCRSTSSTSLSIFNVLRKYISQHVSLSNFFLFGLGANVLNFCHDELISTVYMFGSYQIGSPGYVGDLRKVNKS